MESSSAANQDRPRPRVLVIRGGAIGDFILTLPAIRLLRESIPNVHLEILGYAPVIALAKEAGLAEATRSLEHASMARLFVPHATLDPALVTYLQSFNLIVSYLYDPDGYLQGNMRLLQVKTFLELPHKVEPGQGHAAIQLARPLEKLAMFLDDPAPRLEQDRGVRTEPILALHPGSGSLKKNWPVPFWIQMGRELKASFPNLQLALITGEAEFERGITGQLLDGWRGMDFLHWDQQPLTDLAQQLQNCLGFAGHDSGISHLAAACGLPCHLFFGPTHPELWAPQNPGVLVLRAPNEDLAQLGFEEGRDALTGFVRGLAKKNPALLL